jgi:thiamine-monophosphate kinase
MIDVSDGLLADLGHVAAASTVRIDLELAALRVLGADGVTDTELLTGGDDHALAFTLPPAAAGALSGGMLGGTVVVGRVTAGSGVHLDGARRAGPGGHTHFG